MKKDSVHNVTHRSLAAKLAPTELARLIDCTEQHARDLMDGYVVPTAREHAIMRLCANVIMPRLRSILDDFDRDYEWRRIPGFERYEASELGQIRRAVAGHGSMPGHVLRPKLRATGHLSVNIAPDGGRCVSFLVHRAVCLAFHGPAPSPEHVVCHRNDIPSDNRPENLYWGTHQDNADDRIRNAAIVRIGTKSAQSAQREHPLTPLQLKKATKAAMTYRLQRLAGQG